MISALRRDGIRTAVPYSSLQSAVDAFGVSSGRLHLPAGIYRLSEPLNLRGRYGLTLEGDGPETIIEADFDVSGSSYPIIDAVGTSALRIRALHIRTRAGGNAVGCGVLIAPDADNDAYDSVLESVDIYGDFTAAAAAVIGASGITLLNVSLSNSTGPAGDDPLMGGYAALVGTDNLNDLISSPIGAFSSGDVRQIRFDRCDLSNVCADAGAHSGLMIYASSGQALSGVSVNGGEVTITSGDYTSSSRGGMAAVYVRADGTTSTTAPVRQIDIRDVRFATSGAKHCLCVSGSSNRDVEQVELANNHVESLEESVFVSTDGIAQRWSIHSCSFSNFAQYNWGADLGSGDRRRSIFFAARTSACSINIPAAVSLSQGATDGVYQFNSVYFATMLTDADDVVVYRAELFNAAYSVSRQPRVRTPFDDSGVLHRTYFGTLATVNETAIQNLKVVEFDPAVAAGQLGGPPSGTVFKDGDMLFATISGAVYLYIATGNQWYRVQMSQASGVAPSSKYVPADIAVPYLE